MTTLEDAALTYAAEQGMVWPPPPAPKFLLGASTPTAAALAALEAQVGKLQVHHTYRQWNETAAAARVLADDKANGRTTLMCIKPPHANQAGADEVVAGKHDTDLLTWAALLAQYPDTMVPWWHEPENDAGVNPAGFCAFVDYCISFVRPRVPATVKQGHCLMAFSTTPAYEKKSGRTIADWIPSGSDIHFWDGYAGPKNGRTLEQVFTKPFEISAAHNRPTFIAESGIHSSGTDQRDYLTTGIGWAKSVGCLGLTVWDSGAFVLDAGGISALKAALAG